MRDFTKNENAIQDMTTPSAEDLSLAYNLPLQESLLETEKARYLFGVEFPAVVTEEDRIALNEVIAEDVNQASYEGEVDAMSQMIAEGKIRTPQEAQAMQETLSQVRMPDDVALDETVSFKALADAEETGDTITSQMISKQDRVTEKVREVFAPGLNKANIHAKEQILMRAQQQLKSQRGLSSRIATGFANVFIPFFEAGALEMVSPENKWTESNYQTNAIFMDKLILSPMTPAQFEAYLYGMLSKMSPNQAALFLETAIDRPLFFGPIGTALDATAVGGIAKASVKGSTKAAKLAKILEKEGVKVGKKQVFKQAAKEGIKEGLKAAAKEVPGGVAVVNAVSHPIKTLKQLGLRKQYVEALKDTVVNAGKEAFLDMETVDETMHKILTEEMLHTAASPRGTAENVSGVASMDSAKAEAEYQRRLTDLYYDQARKTGATQQMYSEAEEVARRETLEAFKKEHPDAKYNFEDVDFILRQDDFDSSITALRQDTGKYVFRYRIGTGTDGAKPFVDAETALKFAEDNQIKSVSDIVCDKTGCWIQVDMQSVRSPEEIVSDRFEDAARRRGEKEIKKKADGGLSAWWRGQTARSTSTRLDTSLAAREKESVVYATFADSLKTIERLNKKETGILEALRSKSRQEEAWIDPVWMREQGIPESVIQAYQADRLLNDYEWLLENKYYRSKLTEEGYKKISTTALETNINPDTNPARIQGYEKVLKWDNVSLDEDIWVRIDGAEEPVRITPEQARAYKDAGYRITQSPYHFKDIPANKIKNIYHPKKYIEEPIDQYPIHYVQGGRAFYSSDNIFVKQMNVQSFEGVRYVDGVTTVTAGTSMKAMRQMSSALEEARQILMKYRKGEIGTAQATAALQRSSAGSLNIAGSIEDFNKWATEHRISLDVDAPFEAVEDGQALASYNKIMSDLKAKDLDPDIEKFKRGSSSLYSREQQIKKRHRSGGDIEQLDMDYAPKRMDAQEEAKRLVNNIINLSTMHAYSKYYADNFSRIYRSVIKDGITGNKVLNLQSLVEKTKANADLWDSAAMAIRQYETIRGVPNRFDEYIIRAIDRTLEPFLGADLLRAIHKAEPLDHLREWASHCTFIFSPSQLLKQFSGIANTHLINMGASLEADKLMLLFPVFKHVKKEGALIEALKIVGMEGEDVKGLINFFENVDDVVSRGRYFEGGMLRGDLEKTFIEKGYYFYSKGENGNRLHSAIASLITVGGKGKDNLFRKTKVLDLPKEEYATLLDRYNTYYMNMDAVGTAPLQTSAVAQSLLQFQTYKMRFLEVWCNTTLTKAQRNGFILSHLALFGAMGFGLNNVFSGSDDNALMYTFTHGVLDSAMKQIFGGDEYIPSLSSLGSTSVADLLEIGSTPAGQIIAETPIGRMGLSAFGIVKDAVSFGYNRFHRPYTYEQYLDAAWDWVQSNKNPATGVANLARSGSALFTGYIENSRGLPTASVNKAEALMNMAGFGNLVSTDKYRQFDAYSDRRDKLEKDAKELAALRAKGITAGAQGPDWERYKMRQFEIYQGLSTTEQDILSSELEKYTTSNQKRDYQQLLEATYRNERLENPEKLIRDLFEKNQGDL